MKNDEIDVGVHQDVASAFTKEQIEAVINDAMKILPSYYDRDETLFIVSAKQLAVILDKKAGKGRVIMVSVLVETLDGPLKAKLQAWLAAPKTPYYVLHYPGSWFAGRGRE